MNERRFRQMLAERQRKINSLLCVGLDPLVEKVPPIVRASCTNDADAVLLQMSEIVDATVDHASMFKPQRAHWQAIDGGASALRTLVGRIHYKYPDIPVLLDCKDGDIDRTQRQYREAHFTIDGVDGMNYNGYMGKDTLRSLVDYDHLGRALVGLGRTSNPEAWEVQDQQLAYTHIIGGCRLWEFIVRRVHAWSEEFGVLENAGVVMGAAYKTPDKSRGDEIVSDHLVRARKIVGDDLWFLIPGVGKQGGAVAETVRASYRGPGTIAINSSSDIDFASSGPDFAEAARQAAQKLHDEIKDELAVLQVQS